ncbi:MAG: hypothetical protein V3R16_02375 [Nitrospirales bacterium]
MNYLHQITSSTDRAMAARQAENWGYPRRVLPEEHKRGIWFEYGHVALAWFLNGPLERSMQVHVAAVNGRHMTLGSERNMIAMGVIAELLGATRLYSVIPPGYEAGLPAKAMARYLRIRGWEQDSWGSYIELGGP